MTDARRRLLNNTMYASIALYAEYAAGLVISIIIARHLGPERYGTYALLVWFAAVVVALANNGLVTGVMKFVGEARGQGDAALAATALRHLERLQLWSVVVVGIPLGAVIMLAGTHLVAHEQAGRLLGIVLVAALLRALYVFWLSAAKGFENFRLAARVLGLAAPASVALVVAVARTGAGLEGFVYAYAAVCLLYAAAMRYALSRTERAPRRESGDAGVPVDRIRRHVRYASVIVLLELVVLRQTELFFLDRFSTAENVAFYGIGQSLASSAILLVPGVATTLLLPLMSRAFGEDPALMGGHFLAATRYIVLLAVPVLALCEVFAGDIIVLLYGQDFGEAALVFRVAAAAAAVGVVSASASSYQLGSDRQPAIVAIMAAASFVTLALDWVLIRTWALQGAAAAGAIGAMSLGCGLLWHAARALHVRFDYPTYARIAVAGALAAVPAALVRLLLPSWLALPVGALALVTTYLGLTVAAGGWTRADVDSMRLMTGRLPWRAEASVAAMLDWATARGTARVPRDA